LSSATNIVQSTDGAVAAAVRRNCPPRRAKHRARLLQQALAMVHDDWIWAASAKLQRVREFLEREFRECRHSDFFAAQDGAQVFLIETARGLKHRLVVPRITLERAEVGRLCNAELADTLRLARESCVVLTPQGPLVC
jgi:hypothetical protein